MRTSGIIAVSATIGIVLGALGIMTYDLVQFIRGHDIDR